MVPRKNGQVICSGCGGSASGYDQGSQARLFTFVPLWGYPVYLRYVMRRVDCPNCGVKVEQVPWSEGKSPRTRAYEVFLARWGETAIVAGGGPCLSHQLGAGVSLGGIGGGLWPGS